MDFLNLVRGLRKVEFTVDEARLIRRLFHWNSQIRLILKILLAQNLRTDIWEQLELDISR